MSLLTQKPLKRINVFFIDKNGQEANYDITEKLIEMNPNLGKPTWTTAIRNSNSVDLDKFQNINFRIVLKPDAQVIFAEGEYVTTPDKLTKQNIKLDFATVTPTRIGTIIPIDEIDMQQGDIETILAQLVNRWFFEVEINIGIDAAKRLCLAAQEFQEKIIADEPTKTTFKLGAHVEKIGDDVQLTPEKAYSVISDAKNCLSRMGKETAKNQKDKLNKIKTGISFNEMVTICNQEFYDILASHKYAFASDSGFELFKHLNVTNLVGLLFIPITDLPDGVYFILTTQGPDGAYVKGNLANGMRADLREDATWKPNKHLELERTFYHDVIYKQFVLMFCIASFIQPKKWNSLGNIKNSKTTFETQEYFDSNEQPKSRIAEMSEQNQEQVEKSLGQKVVDKVTQAKDKVVDKVTGNKENTEESKESNQEQNQEAK